jgi:methionyl-tRNA formyltransferase
MKNKINICLLSTITSNILGYILEKLLAYEIPVHSVLLDSKITSERDQIIWKERTKNLLPLIPLHHFEKNQIPFYFFTNHTSDIVSNFVIHKKIDLLVNAGTPRILNKKILSAPRVGVLNCHPGLLPNFRGCTSVEWAIYLDEQIGNTVHLMTEKIDEGPIIIKEGLTFKKTDRYHDIRVKVYKQGFELIARGIKEIMNSEFIIDNASFEKQGRYFKVIDDDKMEIVKNKLKAGNYTYQQ